MKPLTIYLSSSWKNRERVRALAIELRKDGHEVYDFTDKDCRPEAIEIPPEAFPEQFDPDKHVYREYINRYPEWKKAVLANQLAIRACDVVVLMLPCGSDAHADVFYGFGLKKYCIVVGHPKAGDRVPTHMWLQHMLDKDNEVAPFLREKYPREADTGDVVLHKPTGEKWLVAFTTFGGELVPCGWPLTFAKTDDCIMLEKATAEKRVSLLKDMAQMSESGDVRCRHGRATCEREKIVY